MIKVCQVTNSKFRQLSISWVYVTYYGNELFINKSVIKYSRIEQATSNNQCDSDAAIWTEAATL